MNLDVFCFGELIVDLIASQTGDLTSVSSFIKRFGGAPANVAVGLSKLGRSVGFIGQVGQDPFGDFMIKTLDHHQIDTRCVQQSADRQTTLAFVSQTSDGQRDFIFIGDPGRDQLVEIKNLDLRILKPAGYFHFGALLQTTPQARQLTNQLIELASHFGQIISYDPNFRPTLWPSLTIARQVITQTLPKVDIVKLNEQEAKLLTSQPKPAVALEKLWLKSMRLLIITLGAHGCLYRTNHAMGAIKGCPVKAIDTTGAGDAFVAGVLDGLVGLDLESELSVNRLEKILGRANYIAAQTTTQKGAIDAFPTRDALHGKIFD